MRLPLTAVLFSSLLSAPLAFAQTTAGAGGSAGMTAAPPATPPAAAAAPGTPAAPPAAPAAAAGGGGAAGTPGAPPRRARAARCRASCGRDTRAGGAARCSAPIHAVAVDADQRPATRRDEEAGRSRGRPDLVTQHA